MQKNRGLKIFLILFCLILFFPILYITYDRSLTPPPPTWTSPPFTPGQSWEDYAKDFLQSHPQPNALEHYLNAFSTASIDSRNLNWGLKENPWRSVDTILRMGEWSNDYPELIEILELNQKALHEISLGAELKHCELPPIPYRIDAKFMDYLKVQTLGKLMAVNGKRLEYLKQPREALQCYLDAIQFGKDMGQKDQSQIAQLISMAVISIETQPIRHLITQDILAEKDYRKIISELDRIDREQSTIVDLIETEHRWFYNNFYLYSKDPNIKKMVLHSFPYMDRENKTLKLYLFFNQGYVLRNNMDLHQEMITAATTKSYREFVQINWKVKLGSLDRVNRMSSVSSYDAFYTRLMVVKTKIRLTELQSAIHLYHFQKKQWPKSLDDLKEYLSPIPKDPFTDQSFLWSQENSKPFVYSPGPDNKDDKAQITYDPTNGTISPGDIRP